MYHSIQYYFYESVDLRSNIVISWMKHINKITLESKYAAILKRFSLGKTEYTSNILIS